MKQEWHNWRSQGIGSSDAAVILKLFPFGKTPLQLWEERMNGKIWEGNAATEHGKVMEPIAKEWFENKMNVSLDDNVRIENPEKTWIRATVDGIDIFRETLVEIKCPYNIAKHEEVKKTRKVPDIYYPQLQHQLKVTELPRMYFLSFNGTDGVVLEVERDDKFITNMVKEEEKFWNCILNQEPPELTEFDYEERDGEWVLLASEMDRISKEIKPKEKKIKELKDKLISLSNDHHSKSGNLRFMRSTVKGAIDYEQAISDYLKEQRKKIPDLPDVSFEKYRKDFFTKWSLKSI